MKLNQLFNRAAPAALLACLLLPAPALRAHSDSVDLKKWPKNDPIEAVLTKDEKALYKTLADDAQRGKFIDFVYARRSTTELDFHILLGELAKNMEAYNVYKKGEETADDKKKKLLYPGWQTDSGKVVMGFGLPDRAENDAVNPTLFHMTYSRSMPGNLPHPFVVDFRKTKFSPLGPGSEVDWLQLMSKLPADSIWALILPPASGAWSAFQTDPKSVQLKECVPLSPTLCLKAPPVAGTTVSGNGESGAAGADSAPGAIAAGGKIKDPEFAVQYSGEGTLRPNITVNALPTQKAGDTEVRLIISLPGGPFEAQAHLLPLEGSTGSEQEFINTPAGAKNPEKVFKGIDIQGNYYLEARRSVVAGNYELALVVTRGGEFGRVVQAQVNIPRFDDGKLTATNIIFAGTPEKAKAGDPLTLGDLRIIPRTGARKPGERFSLFMVAYGALKKEGGYRLKTQLTYLLVAEPVNVADRKIDFGGKLKLETPGAAFSSTSPLIGTEIQVPATPPAASITTGKVSRQVPLRWKSFKIRAKITDENNPGSAPYETGWQEVQLEK